MTVDLVMEKATIEMVTDKIEEMVADTEGIVKVVVTTENLPASVINVVRQVTKRKIVGRKVRVRSEQLQ